MFQDLIDLIKEFWGFVLFIVIALFLICWMGIATERYKRRPEVFQAWQKLNPSAQITYEEWASLYQSQLLPGQRDNDQVVIVPIHTR